LTADEVADTIVGGLAAGAPTRSVRVIPVADGGDGTLDAALRAGFRRVPVVVNGPTGERVTSAYGVRGTEAVIELADACGLLRLPGAVLDPLGASSYGVGQVMAAALRAGCRRLVLGVGGSASTDGGLGMLTALGAVARDADGTLVGCGGGALAEVASLDLTDLLPELVQAHIVLACDVDNPLLGPSGAVAVYGPQKGVTVGAVHDRLEGGLTRWADVVARATGADLRDVPGAGAAGGVGFGALAVLGATMRPGIDLVLEFGGFGPALDGAALVITGEGSFDEQTLAGKAPVGVARQARAAGVPVVAVCGRATITSAQAHEAGIDALYALTDIEPDVQTCQEQAGPLLARLVEGLARDLL
jgi:glycerate kinase